jgi:hypothetical protein
MNLLLVLSLIGIDYRPAFLEIPALGRPAGMGSAYTAVSDDPAGVFYNPAGINQDGLRFALTEWLLDTRMASGAGSVRVGKVGILAAGVKYLSYGTLSSWDEAGNFLGDFSAYSLQAKIALARRLARVLSVGAGMGYVTEKVDDWSLGRMSGELALHADFGKLGAGLAVRDFMDRKAPFVKALGVYGTPIKHVLIAVEVEHAGELRVKAGAEVSVSKFALRGGYDGQSPCFGLGLNLNRMSLDYALVVHNRLGLVHQLSLGVSR